MSERYNGTGKSRERAGALFAVLVFSLGTTACRADREPIAANPAVTKTIEVKGVNITTPEVIRDLGSLAIKEAEPIDGYARKEFGSGFRSVDGCNMQDVILMRDLTETIIDDGCEVQSGMLQDPYTGKELHYMRGETGEEDDDDVEIDHVVALGNAWETGAKEMDKNERVELANDGLNLLAVDGSSNSGKGDKDAKDWLPKNVAEQCRYVARQILVKLKYQLWVTIDEHNKMEEILSTPACDNKSFVIAE